MPRLITHKEYLTIKKDWYKKEEKEQDKEVHLTFGEQFNAFLCKSDIKIYIGNRGCVDADTEYFNGKDWIRIADYKEGDKVLQYNKNGTAELVEPLKYHKYSCDKLTLVTNKTKSINQCLSDEHNIVYIDKKNRLKKDSFVNFRDDFTTYPARLGRIIGGEDLSEICFSGYNLLFKDIIPIDGYKYCFTVPSGMLVLRREGAINVTGNSSKTSTMLLENIPNIFIPKYRTVFFREEFRDATGAGGIVEDSEKWYEQFGELRGLPHNDWRFPATSRFAFMNYSDTFANFQKNVQGKQFDKTCIDEGSQMQLPYVNILMANLRSSKHNIKPQLVIAANPDPDSWLLDLIRKYIDWDSEYHTHDMSKNGKEMYFFQIGSGFSDAIIGETKEEVYENGKEYIDRLIEESGIKGANPLDAVLSVTCFYMPRSHNPYITMRGGGGLAYEARLNTANLQDKIRFLYGGWKKVDSSERCLVKQHDLMRWYNNGEVRSGTRYASMDISGKGRDKKILVIWDGYHIMKIETTDIKDAKGLIEWTKRTLLANGVPLSNTNFVYDSDGLGWAFSGHFRPDEAFEFVANAPSSTESKVEGFDDKLVKVYRNAKSEAVGKFLRVLTNYNDTGECGISIDADLLSSNIFGRTVKQMIDSEIVGLEWRPDLDGIKHLISTKEMNKKIGYHSDLLVAIIYRFALDIGETQVFQPIPIDESMELMCFLC